MCYGYETRAGYMGRMPDEHWRFFPTEEEYVEAYQEFWFDVKTEEEEKMYEQM